MTRILIVDDEPEIRMLARMMLNSEGYDIDEVKSGEDCLKILKKETYDLILLDVMMPGGIDGLEVCKRIKENEKTRDITVVMFTVRTELNAIKNGKEAGADGQIDKPFGRAEFIEAVAKALKKNQ